MRITRSFGTAIMMALSVLPAACMVGDPSEESDGTDDPSQVADLADETDPTDEIDPTAEADIDISPLAKKRKTSPRGVFATLSDGTRNYLGSGSAFTWWTQPGVRNAYFQSYDLKGGSFSAVINGTLPGTYSCARRTITVDYKNYGRQYLTAGGIIVRKYNPFTTRVSTNDCFVTIKSYGAVGGRIVGTFVAILDDGTRVDGRLNVYRQADSFAYL